MLRAILRAADPDASPDEVRRGLRALYLATVGLQSTVAVLLWVLPLPKVQAPLPGWVAGGLLALAGLEALGMRWLARRARRQTPGPEGRWVAVMLLASAPSAFLLFAVLLEYLGFDLWPVGFVLLGSGVFAYGLREAPKLA
ncbi:hypothetical protein Marky_1468 [Marinithermus hydrothermalis DSM 14884]|uniref:Uncharacterized protein n=1 Tax=Marinithermus hydrothermalis (strain DSM 14884 / JCM 11576 / T1) TaxID=869210 RepID=F2NPC2_MARHT|nr:hypothetical protein Marky_1468 [Marinithermus hydrothermalis DSM 14884]